MVAVTSAVNVVKAPDARAADDEAPELRAYQRRVMQAIVQSVEEGRGETITVEIARQGGKNELSATVEAHLLIKHMHAPLDGVKCAPTFRPQLRMSMRRLMMKLGQLNLRELRVETVNAVALGDARFVFLSAEAGANVVGHTASLLLEVDEAQAVDADKFDREFRPMTATSNATTVMYGTAWDERTLLERAKQYNLELERRDGVRRHFSYDWQMVARYMPGYAAHVEHARATLGETHPTFLTQYCLKTIAGAGRWLSASQRAQLAGAHERRSQPAEGESYVAGLDIGGGEDPDALATARAGGREHDATVLTVGRLVYAAADALVREPRVEIVEHVCWQGEPHETLLPRIIDLLETVWRVARVAVDATGLGETASRLIGQRLGASRVKAVKFSAQTKSDLGFELLAAINGGRLKMYRGDGSVEYREFWRQAELARVAYRANETMNFYVDPTEGHDDMLISAALAVHASRDSRRRIATGSVRS